MRKVFMVMSATVIVLGANLVVLVASGWLSPPNQEEIHNILQTTEETKGKPYHKLDSSELRSHVQAWWFKDQIATLIEQKQEQIDYDLKKSGRELFWEEGDRLVGEFTVTRGGIEDISLRRRSKDDSLDSSRFKNRPFVYGLVGTEDDPFLSDGLVKIARQDNLEEKSKVVVYEKKKGGLKYALPLSKEAEDKKLAKLASH